MVEVEDEPEAGMLGGIPVMGDAAGAVGDAAGKAAELGGSVVAGLVSATVTAHEKQVTL